MTTPAFEPERIVAALNAGGIAYVIVGGLAVAAHGVVRATRDLDLVPDPRSENLDRLAGVLTDLGGEHPIVDVGDGAVATICSLADLRAMKLASGRPRDLVDVAELDDIHGPE